MANAGAAGLTQQSILTFKLWCKGSNISISGRVLLLTMLSPSGRQQQHLGVCYKYRASGPTPDSLDQNLYREGVKWSLCPARLLARRTGAEAWLSGPEVS